MAPKHDPDVWLFDLDNTLYPARCNLFAQIDVRIGRYISDWLKVDAEEARRVQKAYWRDHGTSMRGMMTLHGVDPTRAAMADDIAVNLKPASDMGMRTVWIRTDESVKRAADLNLDHIHHQTDDLATWLADWVAERSLKK